MVKDIQPGLGGSHPENLTDVDGMLFFTALASFEQGIGLWKSDGTEAGTVLVKNIASSSLTNVNGTLFFVAIGSPEQGPELWKSDGTVNAIDAALVLQFSQGWSARWPASRTLTSTATAGSMPSTPR